MRKDMSKIIVERPRIGRGAARTQKPGRTRALVDDDGESLRASAREPKARAQKTKSLNENLSPLKRYLAAQVGRPWNKVYSELSENLKTTSTVQQHVRDHVEDFVAVKTRMRAGEVYVSGRFGRDSKLSESHYRLYVHPRTGLLGKNEGWKSWNAKHKAEAKRVKTERAKRLRVIDAETQLHCFAGVWWEVKLAPIPHLRRAGEDGRVRAVQARYTDVVKRAKLSSLGGEELYCRRGVYATDKRQLSKAELKRHALK